MGFKSKPTAIGTTDTDIYQMGVALAGAVVLGIGNTTAGAIAFTLKVYKQSTGVTTTVVAGQSWPANKFDKVPVPLALEAGDKIVMSAASAGLVAYPTVTDNAAASGNVVLNPRGNYSSIATYAKLDLATGSDGASYVSMVDGNVGNDPTTSPTYWMVNALRGATGTGNVSGPASSVAHNLVGYADTTGKNLEDAGVGIGTSGANVGKLNTNNTHSGNNAFTGANTFDKTQQSLQGTASNGVAADFSTKQVWNVAVNGSAFVFPNPTSPVDGVFYDLHVAFTTSHSFSLGAKFKVGDYVPSATAGQVDRLTFEYNAANDVYYRRNKGLNVGA